MKYYRRQLVLLAPGVVLMCLLIYSFVGLKRPLSRIEHQSRGTCRTQINIGFLKTHKCASTTIQNMLFRFGLRRNLTFMLPSRSNYLGRREPFSAELVRHLPWHPLGYNILAVHNRWHHAEVARLMPPNTTYVTALRDPASVFQSMYAYLEQDRIEPLEAFVEREPIPEQRFFGMLGRNQMLWDLGLPEAQLTDFAAVRRLVVATERRFQLVMIAERLEESLVLLKHLLCWRTEDVVGLRLNERRPSARATLSPRARVRLRRWLAGDYLLYSHFYALFERRVAAFGADRMRREVAELRALTRRLLAQCRMEDSERATMRPDFTMFSERVYGFQPRTRSEFCENAARPELQFVELLRERQLQLARERLPNVTA